jgi:hypothetical protein
VNRNEAANVRGSLLSHNEDRPSSRHKSEREYNVAPTSTTHTPRLTHTPRNSAIAPAMSVPAVSGGPLAGAVDIQRELVCSYYCCFCVFVFGFVFVSLLFFLDETAASFLSFLFAAFNI